MRPAEISVLPSCVELSAKARCAKDVLTSNSIPVRTAATSTIVLKKVVVCSEVSVILGLLTVVGNVVRRTSPQANPTLRRLLTMSTVAINSDTSSILFFRGTKSCKHANQALKRSLRLEPKWLRFRKHDFATHLV